MDTEKFFTHTLDTARANLQANLTMGSPQGYTAHHAARDALDEAHSALSQPAFFAMIDALGGQESLLTKIEQAILQDDDDVQLHQCIYCDATLNGPAPDHAPPAVEDEGAWAALAKDHLEGCEWIATRAHRVNA